MILKTLWTVVLLLSVCAIHAQTHTRKTRSDKGGHYKHSPGYYLKHGYGTTPSESKHGRKGQSSSSGLSGAPVVTGIDSLKASQLVKERLALEEERNSHLIHAAMILGSIFLISLIGYFITQGKHKRKLELAERKRLDRIEWDRNEKIRLENERIQFEKDQKIQFANDLKNALDRQIIWQHQYDDLFQNLDTKTASQLEYAFTEAKNEKKRIEILLLKYPEADVIRMLKHHYWIGMTEEQLIDAKGRPDKIEIEELKTKSKKVYIYGNKSSGDVFNFVDGRLERFKDR